MYLYLFEIYGKTEFVDEKTAHNYLRHPSGAQKATLKYLGAIRESDRAALIKEVNKEAFDKFGKVGSSEHDDEKILISRQFTEEKLTEKMKNLIPDRSIMPRHLDYIASSGVGGATKDVSSLKEAIQALR